ncbi:MAG: ATP-binding protein [Bacteroidota bacterium]
MVNRDNFTRKTKIALAKSVGYLCSNPECRASTTGPHTEDDKSVSIGEAAHITAASPDGPRYDASLTSEERRSGENGIWLCATCATIIDKDETRYPVELLKEWKVQAESEARNRLGKPNPIHFPFQEIDIYFAKHLDKHNESLGNFRFGFVGREKELEELNSFLNSPSAKRFTLTAPGGFGKTRLVYEFLNRLEAEESGWRGYVIRKDTPIPQTNWIHTVPSSKRLALLIDDADGWGSQVEKWEKWAYHPALEGRVKLIFTCRNTRFDRLEKKYAPMDAIVPDLQLEPLNDITAVQLCYEILGKQAIGQGFPPLIVQKSRGVPFVLTAICMQLLRSKKEGKRIEQSEFALSKAIERYLNEQIKYVKRKTQLKRNKIKIAIEVLALISPFSIEKMGRPLCEFLKLDTDQLKEFLKCLIDLFVLREESLGGGAIRQMYTAEKPEILVLDEKQEARSAGSFLEHSKIWAYTPIFYTIEPEPIRNRLVNEFLKKENNKINLLQSILYQTYEHQIIQNLYRAQEVNSKLLNTARELFKASWQRVVEASNQSEITYWDQAFHFAEFAQQNESGFALSWLEGTLSIAQNVNHPYHVQLLEREIEKAWGEPQSFLELYWSNIQKLSSGLTHILDWVPRIVSILWEFGKLKGDQTLLKSCFKIHQDDLRKIGDFKPMYRQQKVLEFLIEKEAKAQEGIDTLIEVLPEFRKTWFTFAWDSDPWKENAYFLRHNTYLPDIGEAKDLRNKHLEFLISYYQQFATNKQKAKIIVALLEAWSFSVHPDFRFGQGVTEENLPYKPYQTGDEVKIFFDFFLEESSQREDVYCWIQMLEKLGRISESYRPFLVHWYGFDPEPIQQLEDQLNACPAITDKLTRYYYSSERSIGRNSKLLEFAESLEKGTDFQEDKYDKKVAALIKGVPIIELIPIFSVFVKNDLAFFAVDSQFRSMADQFLIDLEQLPSTNHESLFLLLKKHHQEFFWKDAGYILSLIGLDNPFVSEQLNHLLAAGTVKAWWNIYEYIKISWNENKLSFPLPQDLQNVIKRILPDLVLFSQDGVNDKYCLWLFQRANQVHSKIFATQSKDFETDFLLYISFLNSTHSWHVLHLLSRELGMDQVLEHWLELVPNWDLVDQETYFEFLVQNVLDEEGEEGLQVFFGKIFSLRKSRSLNFIPADRGIEIRLSNENREYLLSLFVWVFHKCLDVSWPDSEWWEEDPWHLMKALEGPRFSKMSSEASNQNKISSLLQNTIEQHAENYQKLFWVFLAELVFFQNCDFLFDQIQFLKNVLQKRHRRYVHRSNLIKHGYPKKDPSWLKIDSLKRRNELEEIFLHFYENPPWESERLKMFLDDLFDNWLKIPRNTDE